MELVTGIKRGPKGFRAMGLDNSGAEVSLECASQLYDRGLPSLKTDQIKLQNTSPFDWKPCSLDGYGAAFGVAADDANHIAWCFFEEGVRYVVPALAAIRGFLAPAGVNLKLALRHSSLEDFCDYDCQDGRLSIMDGIPWRVVRENARITAIERLTWMYCYPSARRMWSSVMTYANAGHIGFSLPLVRTNLLVKGKRVGDSFFVTSLVTQTITPTEPSFEFAEDCLALGFRRRPDVSRPPTKDATLLLRGNESHLSDKEWAAIEVVFNQKKKTRPRRHDARDMIDAILKKLCDGTAWDRTEYPAGIKDFNAIKTHRQWLRDGRWAAIQAVINTTRNPERNERDGPGLPKLIWRDCSRNAERDRQPQSFD